MVEATGELATKIYSLVEAVKVDGKLRKGANEATKGAERGEAKLVISASDVTPPEVIMHLPMLCKEKDIPFVNVPAKNELGAAAGLPVGTSAVAIVLAGDAKKKLDEVLSNLEALRKKAPKAEKPVEKPKKEKPKAEEKKEEVPKEEPKVEEKPIEEAPKEEPKEVKEEPKPEEVKEEPKIEEEKPKEETPTEEKKEEKPEEPEKEKE